MRILFLNQAPATPADLSRKPRIEALLRSYASPGTEVELGFPDDYPGAKVHLVLGGQSALNGLHHALETAPIVRKAVWAEANGYDAVIQSNTFDPGVEAARLAVRIPVVGLLRTNLHAAATLADRIGITVPLASHVPHTWRLLRTYAMDHVVADVLPLGVYGEDLDRRRDELRSRALEVVRTLVERSRAECIIPLGGALFPYVVDPAEIERELDVPVMNTKAVGIRFAETCVAQRMAHSRLTYPSARLRYEDFSAGVG
jgi:allantoin racemase